MVCASGESCFWTTDGQVLRDLNELQIALSDMSDEVFKHHVTAKKNDFADWVDHVLEDGDCALELRTSKKPSTARAIVVRHLRTYNI